MTSVKSSQLLLVRFLSTSGSWAAASRSWFGSSVVRDIASALFPQRNQLLLALGLGCFSRLGRCAWSLLDRL